MLLWAVDTVKEEFMGYGQVHGRTRQLLRWLTTPLLTHTHTAGEVSTLGVDRAVTGEP